MRVSSRRGATLAGASVALLLAGVAAGGFAAYRGHGSEEADACPPGFSMLSREYLHELAQGTGRAGGEEAERAAEHESEESGESGEEAERDREASGVCLRDGVKKPEPYADLMAVNEGVVNRLGLSSPSAYSAAIAQAASLAGSGIRGTAGSWTPVGDGHVTFDDPAYTNNAFGLSKSSGRISSYAYNTVSKAVYASTANGGVWRSTDGGGSWASIGDRLPTQIVGAIGWTPAGAADGTLIALTGDNAFGGWTYPGAGIYWSRDEGRTWTKATGAPDGAMGFRVAVAPDAPNVVYAATGFGLYRSTDAGRSWTDVALPTGPCAGASLTDEKCFLANVVTDVAVRGKDTFGHAGGAVTAAVGWRAGQKTNPDGSVQAPSNGFYTSETGAPGSFTKVPDASFIDSARVGRVALGAATGPDQDHDYLYALVQDAVVFNGGAHSSLDVPDPTSDLTGLCTTCANTPFNGAYVSDDFGKTWTLMADDKDLLAPTTGSTMAQLNALGSGPGVQSWYNEWIQPNPYEADPVTGAPTRLTFGLEEIWENATVGAPVTGRTSFRVAAPYSFYGGACVLTLATKPCSAAADLGTTTTHPDQHAAMFVPDGSGGVTLLAGNDGGTYHASVPPAGPLTSTMFGAGDVEGLNTLLPYSVAVAKDGVVYSGLQDNGTIRIDPATGKGNEVYGGDGTNALVDPDDSDQAMYAYVNAALQVTHDGGKSSTAVKPAGITDPQFVTPFAFDDAAPTSEITAGRQVFVSPTRLADLTASTWQKVYDLGTHDHPGDAAASSSETDPANSATAVAMRGETAYVGFCGSCDPVKTNQVFHAGIATNAGGTWHVAAADGLPQRVITSVKIDPTDADTVYVGLGSSTVRPYAGPGALGADGTDGTGGHVYRSTDGGASFSDVSGDLPDAGVQSVQVANDQLVVGTTVGVFASPTTAGGRWGQVGTTLPKAPVWQIVVDPANPKQIYVASYGRGIWKYAFADPKPTAGGPCVDTVDPSVSLDPHRVTRRGPYRPTVAGTATDRGCGHRVARVRASVRQSRTHDDARQFRYLRADGSWTSWRAPGQPPRLLPVAGLDSWRFTSPRALRAGRYLVTVRAWDAAGNVSPVGAANVQRVVVR